MRGAWVSVDLDDLTCYRSIYGIPGDDPGPDLVLSRCLPRFLDLFASTRTRATFFVIGRTLVRDAREGGVATSVLRRALAEGHELANHSDAHDYAMTRWPADAIRADLERCHQRLRALGATILGFRAPGYTHDARLLESVAACGYAYDSSLLPSPLYGVAKSVVRAALRVRGRASGSLATPPSAYRGRRHPHRTIGGLWEIPIGVGGMGLPLIGTTLLQLPAPWSERCVAHAIDQPYLHIELHGLDLVDPDEDPVPLDLRGRAPELRMPLALKLTRLRRVLEARPFVETLGEAAGRWNTNS